MQKIFSISSLKANLSDISNPIVIPKWIFDSILNLCSKKKEYAGQLICYKSIVEYPFLTGSGTVGSVIPNKKIILNNSPDYATIEFHTHPSILGEFWMENFSAGDLVTFNNRLEQEGDQYIHLLFTKENILTWGKHNAPDVRIGFGNSKTVINTFNGWNKKHNCWQPAEE